MLHYLVQNVVINVSEKPVASVSWQKTDNSEMLLSVNQTLHCSKSHKNISYFSLPGKPQIWTRVFSVSWTKDKGLATQSHSGQAVAGHHGGLRSCDARQAAAAESGPMWGKAI
jgi:hypothetical protein